jgi:two-component sensor histidine kinase
LGTGIVEVLARQLGGRIEVATGPQGTTVSILSTTTRGALSGADIPVTVGSA